MDGSGIIERPDEVVGDATQASSASSASPTAPLNPTEALEWLGQQRKNSSNPFDAEPHHPTAPPSPINSSINPLPVALMQAPERQRQVMAPHNGEVAPLARLLRVLLAFPFSASLLSST